ncbi:MAG: hypothetical protein ACQKBT_09750 [Puniceicoccales bacterium]
MSKSLFLIPLIAACTGLFATPKFRPVPNANESTVRALYEAGGSAPRLSIELDTDSVENGFEVKAVAKDFWDQPAGAVDVVRKEAGSVYELHPQVSEIGWYRIEVWIEQDGKRQELKRIPGEERSLETYNYLPFAIVPSAVHKENSATASPFGIDTAFSSKAIWLPPTELQLELIRLSGAEWVRDRFSWQSVSPERGSYHWQHYKDSAELLSEYGLKAVQVIQRPIPEWMRAESGERNSFPADLKDAYDFGYSAARNLFPAVTAFEIWNEHDIGHYANRPPDVYASTLKAIALGLKDGAEGEGPTTLIGAFARNPNVGGYAKILEANEIAPYLDAYNFHTYEPAAEGQLERVMTTQIEVSREMGFGNKPIWLTETGRVYGRDTIPEPQEAMQLQVDYLFDAYLTAIDHDIGPVFWFWLTPYYGSSLTAAKDRIPLQFGMVDSYWAPFPVYSAYAWMSSILGKGEKIGIIEQERETIRIFDSGKEQVALIRPTPSNTDAPLRLPELDENARVYNVFGTSLTVERQANGTALVANHGSPIYVTGHEWNHQSANQAPDETDTAAEKTENASPLVIQVTYPAENIDHDSTGRSPNWDGLNSNWTPRGYTFEAGDEIPVTVSLYNFGNSLAKGNLQFDLPRGVRADPADLPYHIEPGERLDFQLTIQAGNDAPDLSRWTCQAITESQMESVNVSQWRRL